MIFTLSKPAVIVPTWDDVDPAIELLEIILGLFLSQERKIPQVVNNIIRTNCMIPVLNQLLIHFARRRVGAIAEADHVFVAKVRISGEEDGHS